MNRPAKFGPSHPAALHAAEKLRELGYYCEFGSDYQEWLIYSKQAAALDRNITKAMKSLLAKLMHRKHTEEWEEVRKILHEMEEIGT